MTTLYNEKKIEIGSPSYTDALDLIVKYKEERDSARLWRDNYKNTSLDFANQIGELNKTIKKLKEEDSIKEQQITLLTTMIKEKYDINKTLWDKITALEKEKEELKEQIAGAMQTLSYVDRDLG